MAAGFAFPAGLTSRSRSEGGEDEADHQLMGRAVHTPLQDFVGDLLLGLPSTQSSSKPNDLFSKQGDVGGSSISCPRSPSGERFGDYMSTRPESDHLLITGELLQRAQGGDPAALETLMARYRPRLERWASGRLPTYARSLLDTGDLVQETLIRSLQGLHRIEVRGPGVFQAYVRTAILNRIRDELRRARRAPTSEVPAGLADHAPSPLELAIGADVLDRFERAMERLSEEEQRLVHLRVELDFGFEEVAALTGRNNADAARIATRRALNKLSRYMGHGR